MHVQSCWFANKTNYLFCVVAVVVVVVVVCLRSPILVEIAISYPYVFCPCDRIMAEL